MGENAAVVAEQWSSLRAYAEHKGVRLSAVQKAIASGRIKPDALRKDRRGRFCGIEWMRADRYWAENTDPDEAAKNGKFHQVPAVAAGSVAVPAVATKPAIDAGSGGAEAVDASGAETPGASAPSGAEPPRQVGDLVDAAAAAADGAGAAPKAGENDSYLQARARREYFNAQSAELEYLKAVGRLVDVAEVNQRLTEILIQVKTSVMQVAERKSQILAAETDPQRVHRILSDELRSALDERSRHFADIAAEGAEERQAAVL